MPAFDRVQVMPGVPRIFVVEVGNTWQTLPSVEKCVSVYLKPRSANTQVIYVADLNPANGASPGNLARGELAATSVGITYDISNPNLLQVSTVSGTQRLEVHCVIGGQ